MKALTRNRLLLVALWLALYASFTLFAPPLLDDADSVHAEVAREMLVRHDFVTLYANGIRYLEKAPLYYWSMAASFKLFGVSTAASRVPLALSVLALALLLESFARRAFANTRAGLYAGLITLSSFGIFIFSRINIPDAPVCVWLAVALNAFWRMQQQEEPSRELCWILAAACALDVLTKGLIGIVFPVGIVLIALAWTRGVREGWARLRAMHLLSSGALFLVIAVPWHVLVALANPTQGHPGGVSFAHGHVSVPLPTDGNVHGWAWFYFVNEQVLRYLNLRVPRDYDTVPLWLFLGLIFVWLLPWSAFLPSALLRAWQARRQPTDKLLLVWAALPLLFFCFSTRQEYYVLPALPAMILLIARRLAEWDDERSRVRAFIASGMLAAGGVIATAAIFFLWRAPRPPAGADVSAYLQQNPADYALSFGHFLDLRTRALGFFHPSLALLAVATLGGTLAHWMLLRRGRPRAAIVALSGGAAVLLLASWLALGVFAPVLGSEPLAKAIAPQLRPDNLIAIHGEYEAGSTLGFYLRRSDLHIVEGRSSNLWYGSFFPDAPKIFETRESIAAKWSGAQRIFLWEDPSDADRPPLTLPGPVYVIASAGGKQILSNQPNR